MGGIGRADLVGLEPLLQIVLHLLPAQECKRVIRENSGAVQQQHSNTTLQQHGRVYGSRTALH